MNTNENAKDALRPDSDPSPKEAHSTVEANEAGSPQIIRKPRRQTVQDLLRDAGQSGEMTGQPARASRGRPDQPSPVARPVSPIPPQGQGFPEGRSALAQQPSMALERKVPVESVMPDARPVANQHPANVSNVASSVLLQTRGLVKVYDGRAVVDGVDINVKEREIVGLLGPNGAGKTTSFYMIVGLVQPNGGNVEFAGSDVTNKPMYRRARLGMGYLPQEESIFRKLTVEQNIMAVLETQSYSARERRERCQELMRRFGIEKLAKNLAITLSGGEKRRLTIARSLVVNPKLLMLDEPFSGVDPIAVGEIQEIICQLREQGLAILITDHNVRETLGIVDRAYLIYEGKVLMEGSRDELVGNPEARKLYLGERFSM
ncbi:MAG: LPS export ABC transporter ATP-binding protein [Verrucomicrobiales bacterium]|nr:LPS export ABC transporter ATP-binding protein [Verrucomicrobiales bacterium]MED5586324.1 LPS export ABC transporter ATP-binding protein [Verrucomicrobiota bacterium]